MSETISHQSHSAQADLAYRVAFSYVTGVGPARLTALERYFETLAEAWFAT